MWAYYMCACIYVLMGALYVYEGAYTCGYVACIYVPMHVDILHVCIYAYACMHVYKYIFIYWY